MKDIQHPYFVYIGDKFYGPLTEANLKVLLRDGKITSSQYIYDTKHKCIFLIGDLDQFREFLPKVPPKISQSRNIFVTKNNTIIGPYDKTMLAEKIELGEVEAFDFVNFREGTEWRRIRDVKSLQDCIPAPPIDSPQLEKGAEGKDLNTIMISNDKMDMIIPHSARRYPRAPFSASANIVYKGKKMKGTCSTLSIGGCFIEVRPDHFQQGEKISVDIISDLVAFKIRTTATITALINSIPKGIGIRFENLDKNTEETIKKFVEKYLKMTS